MKTRVAVLMGGPSSEHEVSLKTGEQVYRALDKEKFSPFPVKVEKDGTWPLTLAELKSRCDIVFIAMHGEYGEDGTVQSLLETFKIPYTGSGPMASAIAMDKERSAAIFNIHGILTPKIIKNSADLAFPLVVKPVSLGSSVGVKIVSQLRDFDPAIAYAKQYADSVMAQRYIKGREFACGVLEINGSPLALLPTEIIPKRGNFFDYASKYEIGGSEEITPPNLPKEWIKLIQRIALKSHKAIGCSGVSRTDLILEENPGSKDQAPKFYVLEINTLPGMTKTSLLPQQAEKMGIAFPRLLEIIIQSGLKQ